MQISTDHVQRDRISYSVGEFGDKNHAHRSDGRASGSEMSHGAAERATSQGLRRLGAVVAIDTQSSRSWPHRTPLFGK